MISLRTASAALFLIICAAPAMAQGVYCSPVFRRPLGQAPDTWTAPRFYQANMYGVVYGPNYLLRPCFAPEQGFGPVRLQRPVVDPKYGDAHPYIPVPPNHPQYPQYYQRAKQQLAHERAQAQAQAQAHWQRLGPDPKYGEGHRYIPVPSDHPQYPQYFQQAKQRLAYERSQLQMHGHPTVQNPIGPIPPRIAGLPPVHTLPHLKGKEPPPISFPVHIFVRSPRDFFMWGEAVEDEESRLRHPALIP